MFTQQQIEEYYQALLNKDSQYEGTFYAAIKTTGIFCRPTCTARKPKFGNCEFFRTAQQSLLAGYRPCKRCQPLKAAQQLGGDLVERLLEAVDANETRRWCDADVRALGLDPSTARRQFNKRFGMTFVAYARARRLGIAFHNIRKGGKVIDAQFDSGYESGSGFRDAFNKIMGAPPSTRQRAVLAAHWLDTPLGAMLALADETHLHLLEFTDRRGLETEILKMREKLGYTMVPGHTPVIKRVEQQLEEYFKGQRRDFELPLFVHGSAFQKSVMAVLQSIPCGETRSYAQQAQVLGNPKAVRAVARANGANQIAVVIPCHRVIGADGKLVGYAGGIARKKWLLEHERKITSG